MAQFPGIEIRQSSWQENQAISAWRELQPENDGPKRLEVLHEEGPARVVYRLVGVAASGKDVIAKRCPQSTAEIELTLYEQILPKLPLPTLHYYGSIGESGGEFRWLFLEDASREKYDPSNKWHRVAAAEWLGVMNTSAANMVAAARLPERTAAHYLVLLESARDTILRSFANPALIGDHLTLLKSVVAQCDHLSDRWSHLAQVCESMPQTLVHGDFISKNVGVRTGRDDLAILPFDWEKAGWGSPAEDISRVDIATYWSTVRDFWPGQSISAFKRLADVGKVFRCLVFLDWIAPSLATAPIEQPMQDIRRCETWLANLIREAPWKA